MNWTKLAQFAERRSLEFCAGEFVLLDVCEKNLFVESLASSINSATVIVSEVVSKKENADFMAEEIPV